MTGSAGVERIAQSLHWQAAHRNDAAVAQTLLEGAELDAVYGLGHARVVDTFFCWLREIGVLDLVAGLRGVGVQRQMIPFETFVLLYFLRCLARVPSQNALPDLLFSDLALMRRLGFNAHQIEWGLCRRGDASRQGARRNLPLDPEALTKNVLKLDAVAVQAALLAVLKRLWAQLPEVPASLVVIIDGTLVEVGPTAKGATVTSRSRLVRTKEGMKSVPETFIGFKVIWAFAPQLELPLGLVVAGAEADERPFVQTLLEQAREVLGGRTQIAVLVIDRGYFKGPLLWELHEQGLVFVIPARKGDPIYEEARTTAFLRSPGLVVHRQSRTETVSVRAREGGPLRTQKHTLEVVGIEGCRTFETYAPAEMMDSGGHHKDRFKKTFEPNPINAVVLTRETGRREPGLVLLTNGPVNEPLGVFDLYDERSRIENQGNRSLKQEWCLERPPQRSRKGVELHAAFVMMAFALAQGFRVWEEEQLATEEAGKSTTLGEYLRRLRRENEDRVIVFTGGDYGIFYTSELMFLLGRRVREPNPHGAQSLEELLQRLNLPPPRAPP